MGFKKYFRKQLDKHPIRTVGTIVIGSFCLLTAGVTELMGIIQTGYFNPTNQLKYLNQKEGKYGKLYTEFINHADQDKNGYISLKEQAEAWQKLGFKGPFFESFLQNFRGGTQFPKPDLSQLEKAIESYNQK